VRKAYEVYFGFKVAIKIVWRSKGLMHLVFKDYAKRWMKETDGLPVESKNCQK
jgi:hypothetical protein